MGVVLKARNVLHHETLATLYYTLYPYLIYCTQVWVRAYDINMNELCLLRDNIVCIKHGIPREQTLTTYTARDHLYYYNIGLFMYKYSCETSSNLWSFLSQNRSFTLILYPLMHSKARIVHRLCHTWLLHHIHQSLWWMWCNAEVWHNLWTLDYYTKRTIFTYSFWCDPH